LDPRAEGHGSKTAVFGQLIHRQDHPPISKEVCLFHGRVSLNTPLLHRLPDNYPLRFRYSFQTRDGASGIYDTPQQLTVWKHPRTVEVTASSSAFYHGDSSRGRRLALMPPSHALMPVVGLLDVDAFLIRSHHNTPYFLQGGKPQQAAGVGIPQYLEALETCESPTAWTTLFKLTHPCGAVLDADTQGVHLTLMNTALSLSHQQYDSPHTVKWQFQDRNSDAVLSLPLALSQVKGVQSHWTNKGLQVEILKRPASLQACTILLDAGHGGLESGTHALNGLPEKTWTLELAKRIQLLLHEAGVSRVFLSREADMSLSLAERQARANDVKADICLSLHANALPDTLNPQERCGVSVHTYTAWSSHLGDVLQHALTETRPSDGRFMSNFAMTRLATCQSVLVEYGYFIHPTEYSDLLEDDTLWHLAHQTVKGLRDSFL
jgi:N-acetylmuramoyl-L-alanine amidase